MGEAPLQPGGVPRLGRGGPEDPGSWRGPPSPAAVRGNCRPRDRAVRFAPRMTSGQVPLKPHPRGESGNASRQEAGGSVPGRPRGPLANGGPPGAGVDFLLAPDPGAGRSSTTADGAPGRPAYGNQEGGVRHQAAPLGRPPARARYGGRARVDGWPARVHYGGCTAGRTGNRHAPPLRESRFPGQPWRCPPASADGALPPPPPSRIPGQRGRVVGTDLLPRQGGVWTRGSGPEGVAVATPLPARAVAAPVMPTGRQGLRHRTAGGVAPDRPGPGPLILRGPGNVYDEWCTMNATARRAVGKEAGN